jgi:hypothetical protein
MNVTRIALSRRYKDAMFFFMNMLPVYEIMWAREISRFILKNNPAVIHVHDLYMSKAAHKGIKRSGRKIPMILDLHDFIYRQHIHEKEHRILISSAEGDPGYIHSFRFIIMFSETQAEHTYIISFSLQDRSFTLYPDVVDELIVDDNACSHIHF